MRKSLVALSCFAVLALAGAAHADSWSAAGISGVTRTPVAGDIVEYRAVLRVGPGEFDKIGIHRVVRERAPWVPRQSSRAVFLVHGSASTFRTIYAPGLTSPDFAPDAGLAPFLAGAGLDVWGIDLRWTFVPFETTDFGFMRDWNLGLDRDDTRIAAKIARLVRGFGGNGFGPLFFAGHSLGGNVIYALADQETQWPAPRRDVRGLIPFDITIKLTSPETQFLRDEAALRYAAFKAQYDSGIYAFSLGAQLIPLIGLGVSAPNDPSPIVPGFTNLEAATAVFSLTYLFYAPLPPYTPFYHFLSGTFDPVTGAPTGFQFADQLTALEWALTFPPHQALGEGLDIDALISGVVDVPYDDHLGQITVPVFHVAAAGGFGVYGLETLGLLGSTDKSSLVVRLLPPGNELFDIGHVDILAADIAPAIVFAPVLAWIQSR